jgi:hypothetical protein
MEYFASTHLDSDIHQVQEVAPHVRLDDVDLLTQLVRVVVRTSKDKQHLTIRRPIRQHGD